MDKLLVRTHELSRTSCVHVFRISCVQVFLNRTSFSPGHMVPVGHPVGQDTAYGVPSGWTSGALDTCS